MDQRLVELCEHAKKSVQNAYANISKLEHHHLSLEGMSGHKTRHLYNNMCSLPYSTYCEVGTWKGSTFITAMYGNDTCFGYCIDNWSTFGGPRQEAINLIHHHLANQKDSIQIHDKDCWTVDEHDLSKPIDIYMYDGAHTYEDQKRAIVDYKKFFAKYVIIMIDDWICDYADVKRGTMDGIEEAGLKIHWIEEIGLVNTTSEHQGGDTFWNGCGVMVCERTDI